MAQLPDGDAGGHPKGNGKKGRKVKAKLLDENCNICSCQLNSWDARLSKALAYKIPVCEKCIADEYDMDTDALRSRMEEYFDMRPCQGI